jgi:DNA-3-methyladenine glycosylase I
MTTRCTWCGDDPLYVAYHDSEWGVPVHDDRRFFEFLILEGAQAGLSWITILKKRENYRRSMDGFDIATVAAYGEDDVARLLADSGIVRNRLKIRAAINNARVVLAIQQEFGSFSEYLWRFVAHRPLCNHWRTLAEMPARTALSDAISKDLKKRGCSFVGSTIIYSLMQATGMANDHVVDCFRHREIAALAEDQA